MPRSQVQRLRCQLAASRSEVGSLEQKIAHLSAARDTDAAKHATTELELLQRLAAADARCRDAEQRALAAEVKLLQRAEADERTGVLRCEGVDSDGLRLMFSESAEAVHRTELADAERAAWANLTAELAANRAAVKRRRKNDRKNRQKERKGKRGPRRRRKAVPQDDDSGGSGVDDFRTAHSVTSTSSASSGTRTSSAKALFVDNICFWIAAFVPYSWAPVNSEAARTVLKVMNIYLEGWSIVGGPIARFQSMGSHYAPDNRSLGPDLGWLYHASLIVQALRRDVWQLIQADRGAGPVSWVSRFMLHMDMQSNMYESMRLEHKGLYLAVRDSIKINYSVRRHIGAALKAFDQRKEAEEEEPHGSEGSNADSSA